jgi:predicted nucleic acid-binding protein
VSPVPRCRLPWPRHGEAVAYAQALSDWSELHEAIRLGEVTRRVEEEAGDLAERHALSGFDAVHLAVP